MNKLFNSLSSVFIIALVLIIIIPLPTVLLDVMLILNITIALLILLTTMYINEALQFSVFPSVLLITTIFRLALNLSSTRLILGEQGEAGAVIKTFGEFVIQGNAVVGFIIFIIIVIVQFLVITKGAERVAEVSARFTLDAMPGKQMAIDADLNSGLIDDQTAKLRRSNIQREADFYGAMDGASKFVKGDAIISILVAFINLIGGAVIGMMSGMPFDEVMSVYTIATVGDGLVSQIPALLISTAMGMIVTRSASESNLNEDLRKQFTSQPYALIIAGCVIFAMCLIPGFPVPILITMGLLLILLGIVASRNLSLATKGAQIAEIKQDMQTVSETDYYKDINNVFKLLEVEPIEMEFGYSLLPLADEKSGGALIERVVVFRKQFALDMGMVFPSIRMRDNQNINPNQYIIKIKGEEVAKGDILIDHYLALDSGNIENPIDGIDTIEPAFKIPAKWINEDQKVAADIAGYTLIDPTSVVITHLSEVIKAHSEELLSRQDIKIMVEKLKENNAALVEEVIPNVISYAYLQKVLSLLLKEGVPIRDLPTILETLGDHQSTLKDIDLTIEHVRQSLKRTITRKFSDADQLRVFTIDAQIENMIISSIKKTDQGAYLALEPDVIQKIISAFSSEVEKVRDVISSPIILTSPIVRVYFKKLVDQFVPGTVVLSFNEIDNSVQIQSIGNIALTEYSYK